MKFNFCFRIRIFFFLTNNKEIITQTKTNQTKQNKNKPNKTNQTNQTNQKNKTKKINKKNLIFMKKNNSDSKESRTLTLT